MICGVCGKGNRPPFAPPPAETAPDLDLRPGEPTRSTLRRWILNCVGCGASAPDISRLTPAAQAVIDQPAYRNELNPFLRWAALVPGDPEPWLQAAWLEDDRGDTGQARILRGRAADLWGTPADTGTALRLLDVLRRAGRFEAAEALGRKLASGRLDQSSSGIVAFQMACVSRRDDGRHLMSSALRPPARTPHVAYRGATETPFWRRLFGR